MSIQTEITRLNTAKTNILKSIKNKGVDTSKASTLSDVPALINNIQTGITPTGTLDITENGTHNVTNYANVNVNVASSSGGGKPKVTFFSLMPYEVAGINYMSMGYLAYELDLNKTYKFVILSTDGGMLVTDNFTLQLNETGWNGYSTYLDGNYFYIGCINGGENELPETGVIPLCICQITANLPFEVEMAYLVEL